MSKHANPIDMKHIALFALLAFAMFSACKKENTKPADETKKPNTGIPKQGLELLTTDADSTYFIIARTNDTLIYTASTGTEFSGGGWGGNIEHDAVRGNYAQYASGIRCTSGPYKILSIVFTKGMADNEVLDSCYAEQVLKPGRYNIGMQNGYTYFLVASFSGSSAVSEVSSTTMPVEIISTTKIGTHWGRNVYRVRGKINTCSFGCPGAWVNLKEGVFQLDYF